MHSSPKSPASPTSPPAPPSRERSDSGIQQSTVDEENTTDWTPEIPFENVMIRHYDPAEIEEDMDSMNLPYSSQKYTMYPEPKKIPAYTKTPQEQAEEMFDHSIQIENNKRMRNANVNTWTLRFKDNSAEHQFSQLREDMFKSNMLCCFIIWLFIVASQATALNL